MAKKKTATLTDPAKDEPVSADLPAKQSYTVVARRYRPQQFNELIGQEHVAQSLVNALETGRVAHAYLFTGSRGVGKTSAARILAKALNCVEGPTTTPCDKCESCKAIATGEDVDVLEFDAASHTKVEQMREILQNVGFRPARSRYKIYIIDEVHMLSTSSFNALLKTLEEPPPHIKFILATTEVQKIPITILSRCQRFDFANVGPAKIFEILKKIATQEGYQADDEALRLIARRAGGSMRDSHSLLDQLIASAPGKLTVESVHAILGGAGEERINELAAAILNRDPKLALDLISSWVERGLQIGELVEQLIGYWRSLMIIKCGGPDVRELPISPAQKQAIETLSQQISMDTILAGLDVWTATRGKMRDTVLAQVVLEVAVVRLARMEDLLPISQLVQVVAQAGGAVIGASRQQNALPEASGGVKKNNMMVPEKETNGQLIAHEESTLTLSENTLPELWSLLIRNLSARYPILANQLKSAIQPAIFGPNTLVIRFPSDYNHLREACDTEGNTLRIQDGLQQLTGKPVSIRMEVASETTSGSPARTLRNTSVNPVTERRKLLMTLPLFRKASEALGAQIWHVDEEFNPDAPPKPNASASEDLDEN
jgi:DNA polymerase-3 subunit gamma/tau